MSTIRVTKEFNFEMAHALYEYEGACKNIHGHSYHLRVCVMGNVNQDPAAKDTGMVIDFTSLKNVVKTHVINPFDHALMLNHKAQNNALLTGKQPFEKLLLVYYQPTCENILSDIVERIKPFLPTHVELHHLHLRETPTSFAEWYAEDNN